MFTSLDANEYDVVVAGPELLGRENLTLMPEDHAGPTYRWSSAQTMLDVYLADKSAFKTLDNKECIEILRQDIRFWVQGSCCSHEAGKECDCVLGRYCTA